MPNIPPEVARRRLQKLLDEIPGLRSSRRWDAPHKVWEKNVKIVLADYYGEGSLIFKEFDAIWFTPGMYYHGQPDSDFARALNSGLDQAAGFLQARIADLGERIEQVAPAASSLTVSPVQAETRKVFVVHGHDHGAKEMVARFLGKLELEPVILHEQADKGKTIIEKFEVHAAEVRCAVVILTADDIASSKGEPDKKEFRARQNVILELGFFVGKLGRQHTFALVEKGVTLPSDIHGVIYIELDDGQWRLRLVRELKAAGLNVDANQAF